jgi:hypothetical protein
MNKEPRYHDPKIVPPPAAGSEITLEFTKQELELIDEAIRDGGFWSREEFFRFVTAKAVKE